MEHDASSPSSEPSSDAVADSDAVAEAVFGESRKMLQLGGQALIEGVLMRSPHFVAAAVRRADGSITTKVEPVKSVMQRYRFLSLPLLRGVVGLFEMLELGMRYLNWSGNMALDSEASQQANTEKVAEETAAVATTMPTATMATPVSAEAKTDAEHGMPIWAFLLTAATSIGFGLLLFVALPNLIADKTVRPYTDNRIWLNLAEGAVKLVIFIAYLWLIGRRPAIQRVFEYHGAEHKVVYAVENGKPVTPDGARPFDTPHPRCGTGFALLVVLVSVICFAFLPWTDKALPRVLMRFALMPLVAGISYEIIKLTTNPRWRGVAVAILTPGLWLQRLTTRQPDDDQLEVSCTAMRAVIAAELAGHA